MKNVALYFLFIFIWLSSCSSERNTLTSKAFHNTTAHYNGYFYALEEIRKIELTHQKNMVDDYNRILRLYPTFDSSLAKGYDKEIQEAVKMASIAIQRHPNSKWVDDSYILVGKARLYSLDWGNAIQTFKHVNTKSKDLDTKHLAIINLIRTYTEHKEYNNAQAAIDYLQKQVDAMSKSNRKKLYLEKAYFYQEQMDYDNMVRNLTAAEPMLKKRDKRGRIYFIIGQVYQKLGFEAEAYNYYEKCLSTNPEYEVDFYARLYMAQVTEISRSKDVNTARKSFKKLLKDNKNREFQDKIYYEMGVFEFKQKNLREAIDNFNLSVRIGTNKRIDGEAYLRMGEIYYESLKDYEKSQAYYDSAISALPTDYDGYAKIKARQEILNEFVKHIKTIQWQDSLLALASLDSVQLRTLIYQELAERKKEEEKNKRKQKKQRNRVEISSNTNSNIFNTEEKEGSAEGADWYFGNSSALALGQNEFQRVWGNIVLEDNWRRSQKLAAAANLGNGNNNSADSTSSTAVTAATQPNVDPADAEYGRLSKEIPKTEKDKQEALHKIEEAYFNLGDIYYFKLLETENAKSTYLKLLGRFPETEHEPEVLYKLYLITKDSIPAESEQYAARLKTKYPGSTFTKILLNPNYLQASSQAAEKQKSLYKAAYELYQSGRYDSATHIITTALAIDETSFSPNLKLLKVLIVGETENVSQYQYELDKFIKENPDTEITEYAQKLLETSRELQVRLEKQKGIQYIKSFEEPHYFVLVYRKSEDMDDAATDVLERFNENYFSDLNLKTSTLALNDEYTLTFVADLPRIRAALEYQKTFTEKLSSFVELRNHKFNNFVITKDNFDIFYRTKGLDEYIQFFEKNYPAESQ